MSHEYDMVVIGGGAAGLTAAGMSAVLGAKTALIEARKLGGDCTWYGCIPSKSLLRAAKAAHEMRTAGRFGLTAADPDHDFARVMERVRGIREQVYEDADAPPHFEKLGVEVIAGRALFEGPRTVMVESRKLTSRYFVIAAGSTAVMPQLAGDASVPVLNNETLFELDRLPKRLVVLGAGPAGIEMAQAFQRLGSVVTVVSRGKGILERDDHELTAVLRDRLQAEGIRFLFETEAVAIERGAVRTAAGERIEADAVFAAVGRKPNIEGLGLEKAGVAVNTRGIAVDRRCRSSAKQIYACGDVAGEYLFTHMAEHMAKIAVTNAILHIPSTMDTRHVAWSTFTDPELAHVGGLDGDVYRFPFTQLDRAVAEREITGMVKVRANRRGRILGASILGVHAGEMIGEYALAMRNGVSLGRLSATIHPYPTYGLGNRRAADEFLIAKLKPWMVRWLQRIFRLRGGSEFDIRP